ncbi:MAG: hypothetical protein CSA35_03450 [Dethiosulfovibrio peptidovorans]|nr:MAG: hypothetical protein CSA35_03450 [Dethiosulfovibrio peptidovorans]
MWYFVAGLLLGGVGVVLTGKLFSSHLESSVLGSAFRTHLSAGPYVVAVGGGTGLSSFLLGLKGFTKNITAVVTVTDEGGSSGRLSRDWGVLPPGDIRNCIVALSENDAALRSFMDFRFDRGDVAGHSLGNLMLLAATEISGDFKLAVEKINQLLAIRGRVLPVSTENMVLMGKTTDDVPVRGELEISANGSRLESVWIEPKDVRPVRDVMSALEVADVIVLGPGSLFTSVIPNLLIQGFQDKIRVSLAPTVYVANVMTQPNETEGMSIMEHVCWIEKILGKIPEYVVVNDQKIPQKLLARYNAKGADPLYLGDEEERALYERGCRVIRGSFLRVDTIQGEPVIRHDGWRLSEAILSLVHTEREEARF